MAESVGGIYYTVDSRTQGLLDAERQVDRSTKRMEKGFDRTDDSVRRVNSSLGELKTIVSAVGGAMAVRRVINYADAWTNLQNQLRQVTETEEERAQLTERLMKLSSETRSGIESTANLYARLTRATTELGLSERRRLRITETINKAFAISGATAQEADAAITQLSQGLASGTLRGDEFNSVAEQAPPILEAVADHLDMTRGELREFAAEGGITAKIVVDALEGVSDEMETRFAKAARSFGQSMTDANNNLTRFVGESQAVSTIVTTTGDSIVLLSKHIDDVAKVAGLATTVIGVRLVQALSASIAKKAAAAVGAKTLTAAYSTMGARAATTTIAVRGLSSAMALLGGPAGVVALAVSAMVIYRDELDDMLAPTQRLKEAVSDLTDEIDRNSRAALENGIAKMQADMAALEAQAKEARAEIERINEANNTPGPFRNSMVMGAGADERRAQFDKLGELGVQIQARKDGIESLQESLNSLGKAGGGGSGDPNNPPPSSGSGSGGKDLERLRRSLETEREAIDREYRERNALILRLTESGSEEQRRLLERSAQRREDQRQAVSERLMSGLRTETEEIKAEYERRREEIMRATAPGSERDDLLSRNRSARDKAVDDHIGGDPGGMSGGLYDDQFSRYQQDEDGERERYAAQLQRLQDAREQQLVTQQEYNAREQEAAQQHASRLSQIEQAKSSMMMSTTSDMFGSMADAARGFAGEQSDIYQAMFAASKAFAIADAAVKIQQGIANAASLPFPANLGAMGTVAAATASIVGNIGAISMGGRQYGGNVQGGGAYRVSEDGKPELLTQGTQQYLLPGRSGKVTANKDMGGDTSIVVNAPITVEAKQGVSNADAHRQGKLMGEALRQQVRMIIQDEQRSRGILR